MKLLKTTTIAALTLSLSAVISISHAYPERVVKVLVGYPPGGTLDVPARILANELTRLSGQTFIIENRPGASATLAGGSVAKADPDGYTLLLSSAAVSSAGALMKQIPFDPIKSFEHIGLFTTLPTIIVARNDFPANNLQEVIDMAKAKPGGMTYGSPGPGTSAHMAGQVLNKYADINIQHIPFKGAAQSLNNLQGGHVDLVIGGLSSLDSALRSKQIKAFAVTNTERSPDLIDAPTIGEALPGVKIPAEYQFTSWLGISAPAGTPPAVVEKLASLMKQALDNPKVREDLIKVGVQPKFVPGAEMVEQIRIEVPAYERVVKEIGISE